MAYDRLVTPANTPPLAPLSCKTILVDATQRSLTVPTGGFLRIYALPPASGVAVVHYSWTTGVTRAGAASTSGSSASSPVITSLLPLEIPIPTGATAIFLQADSRSNLGSGYEVVVEALTARQDRG